MSNKRTALMKMTDDVKKAVAVPFKVKKDKKALESWIIDVESDIATLEVEIEESKGADTLNPDKVLDKVDELELKQRRLKQGQELLEELFINDYKEEAE